jgi:hypothetical protein
VHYVFWFHTKKVTPNYELWETAARFELADMEEHCRKSALGQVRKIIEEGEGLGYFLEIGVRAELLTTLIKELYCRGSRDRVLRAEDAVLQQMAAAQM